QAALEAQGCSAFGGKRCYDVVACTLHRVISDTVRVAKPQAQRLQGAELLRACRRRRRRDRRHETSGQTSGHNGGEDQSLGYDIREEPGECPCGVDRHGQPPLDKCIYTYMGSAARLSKEE